MGFDASLYFGHSVTLRCLFNLAQFQVDNMMAWGNAIGNEFYEYKLPADFRRPTNDQTAEKFIRY